jgi:hypothetical protein
MFKKFVFTGLLCCSAVIVFAQGDSTSTKKMNHYLGVQANQLIRQVFNFSNNNSAVNNPYLLVYSFNHAVTGHGLNSGLGYSITEVNDGDAFNKRETTVSNLAFRLGWERKKMFGKKWIGSYGLDLTLLSNKNETTNSTDTDFNKSKITTENNIKGTGFGPRVTINYMLTSKLIVGTEVNYYFSRQKHTAKTTSSITVQEFDPNTGGVRMVTRTDVEESDDKTKRLELSPPVAIFLLMKL